MLKNFLCLIKKAQDMEQLTPIQKMLNWDQLFLNEERYKHIKDLKKDEVLVKFFNKDGFEEKFVFQLLKFMMKRVLHISHYILRKLKKFI